MPTYSVARIIQAEAPSSSPAGQFAVASVIYNRMQNGGFGGTDAVSVANAPGQFAGHLTGPGGPGNVPTTTSSYADQLGAALEAGQPPPGGSTGNALYFQSNQGQPSSVVGGSSANIGGNYFSDRFGQPSSNFQAPTYTGSGDPFAGAQADASGGDGFAPIGDSGFARVDQGFFGPFTGAQADAYGGAFTGASADASSGGASGIFGTGAGGAGAGAGASSSSGQGGEGKATTVVGVSNTFFGDLNKWISDTLNRFGSAFQSALTASENSIATFFGGIANWFLRGFLIILGVILVILALVAMTGRSVAQVMQPRGA